jgi:death-on-curing protein
MLRVTTLYASTAAATAAYYTRYLTEADGERPGRWTGRQADLLGLSGEVATEALEALLEGRDPISRSPLGRPLLDRVTSSGKLVRALHAPAAGFGDDDFYPDAYDKAAVLACRIAWNHPLPDGNKRAAWACLVLFLDLNGGTWSPDPPNVDDAVETMLRVAAREVDEHWFASWLRDRVDLP